MNIIKSFRLLILLGILSEACSDSCKLIPKHGEDIVLIDCSGLKLQKVPEFSRRPNITSLDLHNNNLTWIPEAIFSNVSSNLEILDLSFNQIHKLHVRAFTELFKLKILELGHNRLCLTFAYPEGLFKDLRVLHTLYTLGNNCSSKHKAYPDYTFKDLISLERLSLDVAQDFIFRTGFRELKHLRYLEATDYEWNNIAINNKSFYNFKDTPLTSLVLRGHAYKSIEYGSLTHLKYLTHINFACTKGLDFTSVMSALRTMPSDTIETIIFDGREMEENANFCHQSFNNVKRLSIRATGISKINMKYGTNRTCLDRLEHLNVASNTPPMLTLHMLLKGYTPSFSTFGIEENEFWAEKPIQILDISNLYARPYNVQGTYCKLMEQDFDDYFQSAHSNYVQPPFPNSSYTKHYVYDEVNSINGIYYKANGSQFDNISYASVFHLTPSPSINIVYAHDNIASLFWWAEMTSACPYVYYPPDGIVYLNVSNNNMKFLSCPFFGMKNLRVLDSSRCKLDYGHEEALSPKYLPNLETLHLQENNLGSSGSHLSIILRNANALKDVNLAKNNIKTLLSDTFENMRTLESLDLSNNFLATVDLKISNLIKLQQLDLRNNQLLSLPQHFQMELEALNSNGGNVSIDIRENPFTCSCDNIQFIKWIQNTRVNVFAKGDLLCHDRLNSFLITVDIDSLEKSCDKKRLYVIIISILGGVAFMAIMVGTALYRYRWKIAWHVYTCRKCCSNKVSPGTEFELANRQFDAFVAYAVDDDIGRPWVVTKLRPHVENNLGKELHIFDRNSRVGNTRIGEIIHGMKHSTKTIFVITDLFFNCYEWEMVLHWAVRRGLDSIVLCCLDGFTIDRMPSSMAHVALEVQERFPTHYLEILSDHDIPDDARSCYDIL